MERKALSPLSGAVSPQGGDFSEPVTQNTKRFVRCFWGLDKALAYARHFPAIHWLTSYSEYLEDLTPWYREHVSPKFVADRNQLMAILNQESSLMEIVKLIGSDVLPDDQKLTLEIARVIRLGFLQQNAFHAEDTCVPMEKQFKMMETILYLYEKLPRADQPRNACFHTQRRQQYFLKKVISIKYDVANNQLEKFDQYKSGYRHFLRRHYEEKRLMPGEEKFMAIEYLGLSEINGPLVVLEGVKMPPMRNRRISHG